MKENKTKTYKYPFVPKDYYPAVMFTCKLIRETGYFNKAIHSSARYYQVDEKTLERYVKERQNAGKTGKPRNYKFYSVIKFREWLYGYDDEYISSMGEESEYLYTTLEKETIKALSEKNAKEKAEHYTEKEWYRIICIKEFNTQKEADEFFLSKDDSIKKINEVLGRKNATR